MGTLVLVLIVSALVTKALGGPVHEDTYVQLENEVEKHLHAMIEKFRTESYETDLKMPPLATLVLDDVTVEDSKDSVTLKLILEDVRMNGFSSVAIRTFRPDLRNRKLIVDLTVPTLTVNGNYDLNGKLIRLIPIFGDGPFEITLFNPSLKGTGNLAFAGEDLIVENLALDFDWIKLEGKFDNLLGGGKLGSLVSKAFPYFSKQAFNLFRPDVMGQINRAFTYKLKLELNKPQMKDVVRRIRELY